MLRREAWTSLLLVFVNEIFVGEQMDVENMMPEYLSEAMRYMEEHINGPLQLTRMAEKLGLHPVYLSSQFKRYTGLTVRDYHIDRRITRARMLLEKGLNVSEACMEAGFNDYANFIRTFKKRTGLTPGTFRRTRPSRQTGG